MMLMQVSLPYGVTTIEPEAFCKCGSLRHITLPESVKVIGTRAFAESGLVDMKLVPRIKMMAYDAFEDCSGMKLFVVPEGYKADSFGIFSDKVESMIVPNGLKHLCENAPRDEWYYGLEYKDLDEALKLIEEDDITESNPFMITLSGIDENMDYEIMCSGNHHLVSPTAFGPFFNAKDAYEALREVLSQEISCIEPADIDLLAANLVLERDMFDMDGTFDLPSRQWEYAVCFHSVPGLKPGKPIYSVLSLVWHSASFHPFYELFGFARTKAGAKLIARTAVTGESYPFTVEKPEIIEMSEFQKL